METFVLLTDLFKDVTWRGKREELAREEVIIILLAVCDATMQSAVLLRQN
jgi:hypothetical protein